MIPRFLIVGYLILFSVSVWAQESPDQPKKPRPISQAPT